MIYYDIPGKFFKLTRELSFLEMTPELQEYIDNNPDVTVSHCYESKLWEDKFARIVLTHPYTDFNISDEARYEILVDALARDMQYKLIFPNKDKLLMFKLSYG